MKHFLKPVLALASFAVFCTTPVQADTLEKPEKLVIALKTNDFELTETDVSELAIGQAQTIETESGRVIDILRTADGVEIYVDGELLEMNAENVDQPDAGNHVFIHNEIELSCTHDDEEGTSCDEHVIWTSDGEEIDHEELHEMHKDLEVSGDGKEHKVIVIKKEIVSED